MSLSAPQVGIAGALGLATIAAPLSGLMSTPAKMVVNADRPVAMAPAPEFPGQADAKVSVLKALRVIPASDPSFSAAAPASLVPHRVVLVAKPSRSFERAVLPGCDGIPPATKASNGLLNTSTLCTLWDGQEKLRADAAVALAKLNVAYRQRFGKSICITDSYRNLAQQRSLKSAKPGLAAAPGTSNHGWGLAVDLCDGPEKYGTVQYQWLRANGPAYGWDNPDWARSGGSGPHEAWHWEYFPGVDG
jgi:hypothetical protein